MEKTLADTEPRYLELIMGLNDAAYTRMDAPDFVRVLPPQRTKRRVILSTLGALKC